MYLVNETKQRSIKSWYVLSLLYNSSDQLEFGQVGPNDKDNPLSSAFWIVCISGPFTFIAAILHAALWRPLSPFMGAVVSLPKLISVCNAMQ